MKAELLPLKGKYYGTEVVLTDDKQNEYVFSLWNSGSYEPSDRQLDGQCTIEQWRNNEEIPVEPYEWDHRSTWPAREVVEICDDHFESRETYAVAVAVVEAINTLYGGVHEVDPDCDCEGGFVETRDPDSRVNHWEPCCKCNKIGN